MKRSVSVDNIVDSLLKKQKIADEMWPDDLTVETVRNFEKIQEQWLRDSKETQKREAERVREIFSVHPTLNVKPKDQMIIPPRRENKPLTVEEAKRLEKLQDELKADVDKSRAQESEEKREIEMQNEPVVSELRKLREELKKKDDELKELRTKPINKPLLFRPRVNSTPSRRVIDKSIITSDEKIPEQDVFYKDTEVPERHVPPQKDSIFEAETLLQAAGKPLPESGDDDMRVDESIQAIVDSSGTEVGPLARQYLSNANDGTFGINYDIGERKLKVGNSHVTIANDDIIVDNTNERFTGTPGLWRLLPQSGDIGGEQYIE